VGEADRVRAGADLLSRKRRALARLEVEVNAFLRVPAELLGVVVGRVIAARHPVQDEIEFLLCRGWKGAERHCGGDEKSTHGASSIQKSRCYHPVTIRLICTEPSCPPKRSRCCDAAASYRRTCWRWTPAGGSTLGASALLPVTTWTRAPAAWRSACMPPSSRSAN